MSGYVVVAPPVKARIVAKCDRCGKPFDEPATVPSTCRVVCDDGEDSCVNWHDCSVCGELRHDSDLGEKDGEYVCLWCTPAVEVESDLDF